MEAAVNTTPIKVKRFLTSFIFPSVEESSSPNINRSKNTNSWRSHEFRHLSLTSDHYLRNATRPRDRGAFFDRINTYSVNSANWFAKPASLSPAQCARYGWINTDKDLLRCVSCHAYLSGQISTRADPQVYAECCQRLLSSLKSGHKNICPWSNCPCPDAFLSLSLGTHEDAVTKAKTTVRELEALGNYLPIISHQTWADMDLLEDDLNELVKLLIVNAEDPETKDIPDDSTLSFPDDSSLTQNQTKVVLAVSGWNLSGSSKRQLECLHCNRCVGLWSCHSAQTRTLMEEQNKIVEAEADDTQATIGFEDMKIDKVMGGDDLISDNKMQEKTSEMDTNEDVNIIVSDILNDVIACCMSKIEVEQSEDDNGNSMPTAIHPEAKGQFTLENMERFRTEKPCIKDENDKYNLSGAGVKEVVESQGGAESIILVIIEDLIRKCEMCGMTSTDNNWPSRDGKLDSSPLCNTDAKDEVKSSVENSEGLQSRSSFDENPGNTLVHESIILVTESHQDDDEDMNSIHIINDPGNQYAQFGKISEQCLVARVDVRTSDGDDQKIISDNTVSASEKLDLGPTEMSWNQGSSQQIGNILHGDSPVMEEGSVSNVCSMEEEGYNVDMIVGDQGEADMKSLNNETEKKLSEEDILLVSGESVTLIQDKSGVMEESGPSQSISTDMRDDAITQLDVECSASQVLENSTCTNSDTRLDSNDKQDSLRTITNNKRKMNDENATEFQHDSSQNEVQPPRKKIKSKMTLSYFRPVKEHRSWCPWVTKESIVLADDRLCDQDRVQPGWMTFVELLLASRNTRTTRQKPEITPLKVNISGLHGILQKLTSPIISYQQV